eukprot:3776149-Pyramimonas_sp.AAC.1
MAGSDGGRERAEEDREADVGAEDDLTLEQRQASCVASLEARYGCAWGARLSPGLGYGDARGAKLGPGLGTNKSLACDVK